ncbi:GAF domain-containing SpoIIE family protein phosphatase [uncultured Arthrobacter sp.]|uniref:PP2C family protein-serine/threonine phosphatase n=1 Tax=uncultured Arthrobacter sp. TaxID=114050 RepID=UPI0028D2F7FC|nr:GAF domain-containing SpoIIE family protein phosphatase [uncultured Arthrobacter sp.]
MTVQQRDLIVVPDARKDPHFKTLPDVTGGRGVRFYAGRTLSGQPVGTLCLYHVVPRTLDEAERRTLDGLGTWAEHELQDSADQDRAYEVQQALLPVPSGTAGYELAGICLPYRSVGGDFYSWRETPDRVDLTLVDVMGKGTAAALMAAIIRTAVRAARQGDPAHILDSVAETLREDLDVTGILATAIQATIHTGTGEISFADAGHGLSLIVGADGSCTRLPSGGFPVGVGEPGSWPTGHARLEPGDTLICSPDGLLDLFGGTLEALDHVAGIVQQAKNPASVMQRLRELTHGLHPDDDLTAIAVRRSCALNSC